jgi:hypothetical protein
MTGGSTQDGNVTRGRAAYGRPPQLKDSRIEVAR